MQQYVSPVGNGQPQARPPLWLLSSLVLLSKNCIPEPRLLCVCDHPHTACSFTPWVHLHGVMWRKWWLESNPDWQQLAKQWNTPMGGNAGKLGLCLFWPPAAQQAGKDAWNFPLGHCMAVCLVWSATGDARYTTTVYAKPIDVLPVCVMCCCCCVAVPARCMAHECPDRQPPDE